MAFTYDPETVVDKEFEVLPEGEYPFETISAKEDVSKSSGKDMLVLTVKAFDLMGKEHPITIYIVDTTAYHLKTFWNSVGDQDMFEKMAQAHDGDAYIGKCGVVKTKIETSERDGVTYKNAKIHYFVKKKDQKKSELLAEPFVEDEIPF